MEDHDIVALYYARSEAALLESAAKYGGLLHSLARRFLHTPEEAEEIVSDTYFRAWNAIPPAAPQHLGAFLLKLCRHAALDRLDFLTAQKRSGEQDALLSELSDCIPGDADTESAVLADDLRREIEAFLSTRRPADRVFFLRRYFLGESIREIAAATGAGDSRIKTSLHRTRAALRQHLEKEGLL